MKSLTLIVSILFIGIGSALGSERLVTLSTSDENFLFDYQTDYLNLNVSELYPPQQNSPSWWDCLWGKKTNFGLIYVEYEKDKELVKIPLFSYNVKSSGTYEIDSVGVLNSSISYPIIKNLPYSPSQSDNIKIAVHYWEDKKQADVIKLIIGAAKLLGGMEAATIDKATNISTTAITLIEDLWPSEDQKSTVSLSLIAENLKKKKVTFGYKKDDKTDQVLTIELNSRKGYFVGQSLSAALDEFHDDKIEVWRGSITEVDNNIAATGVGPVINQITSFSNYISNLPLNYADKVLFLANAIDSWAINSIQGVPGNNGTINRFTMANYRKLPNADWEFVSRQSNNIFEKLNGADGCSTEQCKKLSSFVSQASSGFDVSKYLAPTVSIVTKGTSSTVERETFKNSVSILNDVAWSSLSILPEADNRWIAKYAAGTLKISVHNTKYVSDKVYITVMKVDDNYFIQAIEII